MAPSQLPSVHGDGGGRADGHDHATELRMIGSRMICFAALVFCAFALVTLFTRTPPARAALLAGLAIGPAVVVWLCYGRPRARLDRAALTVVNPLRTHVVPWHCITGFDLRLGLSIKTLRGRSVTVWALPSSGRRTRRGSDRRAEVLPDQPTQITAVLDCFAQQRPTGPTENSADSSAANPADRIADSPADSYAGTQERATTDPLTVVALTLGCTWFVIALLAL